MKPNTFSHAGAAAPKWVAAMVFPLSIAPLFAAPFLPLVDYYKHVIRYFLLAEHIAGRPIPAGYGFEWSLVPNLGGDMLALPFFALLHPEPAATAFLAFTCLVVFLGAAALSLVENGRLWPFSAVLASLLLFNHVFHWGFVGYLLSTGLSFMAVALWATLRERSLAQAIIAATLLSPVIYVCHGLAFAVYGVILAAYEVGRLWELGRLRLKSAALVLGGLALTAVPAILIVILTGYEGQGRAGTVDRWLDLVRSGALADKVADVLGDRLLIVARQLETSNASFDLVFNGALYLVLCGALATGVLTLRRRWVAALSALAVGFLIVPPSLAGVGYVSDRFFTVALLLFAAVARPGRNAPAAAMAGVAGVFLLTRTAVLFASWSAYAPDQRAALGWTRHIQADDIVLDALPHLTEQREDFGPRCNMWPAPFVWRSGASAPTFSARGGQVLRMNGRLETVVSRSHPSVAYPESDEEARAYNASRLRATATSGADFVITCHDRLFGVDPGDMLELVEVTGPYRLYRPLAAPTD